MNLNKEKKSEVDIGKRREEIIYNMGIGERVVGKEVWLGKVMKGYEEVKERVKRIEDNDKRIERVIEKK